MANENKLNDKQLKVINFLTANKGKKFTLAEIATAIGEEVKSGTTNTLVKKGLMTCYKNEREIVCSCCGHKTKVSTYEVKQQVRDERPRKNKNLLTIKINRL